MQTAEPPLETTEPVPDKPSMVGQNGIKPDVWYELDASGRPVKVAE